MNKAAIISFAFGVGIGAAGSWFYLKRYFKNIANEEIESVVEVFSNHANEDVDSVKKDVDDELLSEASKIISDNKYSMHSKSTNDENNAKNNKNIYVIKPGVFGDDEDYDHINFTYFEDGVVADENNRIVENVEECIGEDALNHFGEYEDDSVYVKNDILKCYYEILKDERCYFTDVVGTLPHDLEE